MVVIWLALTILSPWTLWSWAVRCFPLLHTRRRALAWLLGAMSVSQWPLGWIVLRFHLAAASALHAALDAAIIATAVALVPLAVVRGLISLSRGRAVPEQATVRTDVDGGMSRRRIVEGGTGLALLSATGTAFGWGARRGRHEFQVRELAVRIPNLPRTLDGYVIVQISDIHAGEFVGERELDEGLAYVRSAKPDLLCVTGDLVDFDPRFAPMVARKLADQRPRDGIAVALGNHDYYAGAREVTAALRREGIEPLLNNGRVIRPQDKGFALLAVDDLTSIRHGGRGPQLAQAQSTVPADLPRILLSHQPQTVDLWPGRVALQLSGHTHGGQINPGFGLMSLAFPYLAGKYAAGSTTLYVNRGFGTVGPPTRIGVPPEVTRIVLVSC